MPSPHSRVVPPATLSPTAAPLAPALPAGCDSLSIEVQPGMDTVPGAAFLLNITLNSKAGMLLPNSENSVPSFFLGK